MHIHPPLSRWFNPSPAWKVVGSHFSAGFLDDLCKGSLPLWRREKGNVFKTRSKKTGFKYYWAQLHTKFCISYNLRLIFLNSQMNYCGLYGGPGREEEERLIKLGAPPPNCLCLAIAVFLRHNSTSNSSSNIVCSIYSNLLLLLLLLLHV